MIMMPPRTRKIPEVTEPDRFGYDVCRIHCSRENTPIRMMMIASTTSPGILDWPRHWSSPDFWPKHSSCRGRCGYAYGGGWGVDTCAGIGPTPTSSGAAQFMQNFAFAGLSDPHRVQYAKRSPPKPARDGAPLPL